MKRAEAGGLKVQPDGAGTRGRGDGVILDVVNLERAGSAVAQHHVGRAVLVEAAKPATAKLSPTVPMLNADAI